MRVRRILAAVLLFLVLNLVMPIEAVSNVNEIVVRKSGIEWIYIAPRMPSNEHQKLLSKNLTIAYNRASYVVKNKSVRHGVEGNSINMSLVFVGYERVYFRLTYMYPNITVTLDSNIVIGKNDITIQWFSIKTRKKESMGERGVINYTQLNKHVAKAIEVLNMSMVKSYSAYALEIATEFELIEIINVYDVVIDKDLYVQAIGSNNAQGYECHNLEEIPVYAWIKVDKVTGLEEEVVAMSITSLSANGMYDGIRMTQCVIPLVSIVIDIVEGLDLDTRYSMVAREHGINVKNMIVHNYKAHIENAAHYIKLFEELVNGTPRDAYIRTEYVITTNELHLSVVVDNIVMDDLSLQEVRNVLFKILKVLYGDASAKDLDWQNMLNEASIRIAGAEKAYINDSAPELPMAKKVVVLTYVLVLLQTVIIVAAILSTLRPRHAKP